MERIYETSRIFVDLAAWRLPGFIGTIKNIALLRPNRMDVSLMYSRTSIRGDCDSLISLFHKTNSFKFESNIAFVRVWIVNFANW